MRKRRQHGAALIELALVFPLLLLLMIMTTEFGRALHHYNIIAKSVRDAVRYISVQTPGTHQAEARNLVLYGKLTPGSTDQTLVPGLTAVNVPDPEWATAGSGPLINTVTVSVNGYTFRPLLLSVFGIPFGNFTFSEISTTMRAPLPTSPPSSS